MLSVSMLVDRKGSPKPLHILPRMPCVWLDDDSQISCFSCSCVFNILRRKHHCRSCGRLFCRFCVKYGMIPISFKTFVARYSVEPVLMCVPCLSRMTVAWKSEHLMTVIACLPLTWSEILNLRVVSKHWHGSVNTLISIWRSLLYRLQYDTMTRLERTLLKNHSHECAGHYPWSMIACNVSIDSLFLKPISKHRTLFCSRHCNTEPSLFDLISLLYTPAIRRLEVRKWLCVHLARFDTSCLVDTMLWWVYISKRYDDFANDFFIPYCASDKYLAFTFYFCCHSRAYRKRLLSICKFSDDIVHSDTCFSQLIQKVKTKSKVVIEPFLCPWSPFFRFQRVVQIKHVRSASRPYRVMFQLDDGSMYEVLIKFESLRRDYLVSLMMRWMIRLKIASPVHYDVFEYSTRVGCVGIVPNSKTLYKIKYDMKISLEHYILNTNRRLSVELIRDRFLNSLVCSTVLAYVLGVGDRHLENILITDNAQLVHIDFEYMFGDQPFGQFRTNAIRLTKEMVDTLGGEDSSDYDLFKVKCVEMFQSMRVYISFWYRLFSWLGHEKIYRHFIAIFQHGEFDHESCYTILHTLDQRDTILEQLLDIGHSVRAKLL